MYQDLILGQAHMLHVGTAHLLLSVDGAQSKGQVHSHFQQPRGSQEGMRGTPSTSFLLLLKTDGSLTFPAQERLSTFICYLHLSL